MTSAKHWTKKISDITECPICALTFTDPKVLPCGHTFCLSCLMQCGKGSLPGDQLSCPYCRANFAIPPGGLENLPTNYILNALLFASKETNDATEQRHACQMCDVCKESRIYATANCIDCEQYLCAQCCVHHGIQKATKSHQVASLKYKRNSDGIKKMTASYCPQHADEQIKFYCRDCKMVICVAGCITEHHVT